MKSVISKLKVVASSKYVSAKQRKTLLKIAKLLIGRGDPANIFVTSPDVPKNPPKDSLTTLKDNGDTLVAALKLLKDDKKLGEVIANLNKNAVRLQKNFDELSKSLLDSLTPKDKKESGDSMSSGNQEGGLLKQSTIKEVADVIKMFSKELTPQVEASNFIKQLHDQTQKEVKREPEKNSYKSRKKVDVKPRKDD
jgi:hypothetical protein